MVGGSMISDFPTEPTTDAHARELIGAGDEFAA